MNRSKIVWSRGSMNEGKGVRGLLEKFQKFRPRWALLPPRVNESRAQPEVMFLWILKLIGQYVSSKLTFNEVVTTCNWLLIYLLHGDEIYYRKLSHSEIFQSLRSSELYFDNWERLCILFYKNCKKLYLKIIVKYPSMRDTSINVQQQMKGEFKNRSGYLRLDALWWTS